LTCLLTGKGALQSINYQLQSLLRFITNAGILRILQRFFPSEYCGILRSAMFSFPAYSKQRGNKRQQFPAISKKSLLLIILLLLLAVQGR
jgi:hypothetical protein